MSFKKYPRQNPSHNESVYAGSAEDKWSKNELRTILVVAALGTVRRDELVSVQSKWPASDWFEGQYQDGELQKKHLSWEPVETGQPQYMTLRGLIAVILGMKDGINKYAGIHVNDVRAWMDSPNAQVLLDECIAIPHTIWGLRLGYRPSSATIELYKRALALCSDSAESDVVGALIRIEDAAHVLRHTIDKITPRSIYQSTSGNGAVVAKALLSHASEVSERGDEIDVVKSEEEQFETVVISTTLNKELLFDALKLPPNAIKWKRQKKKTDSKGSSICDVRSALEELASNSERIQTSSA